MHSITHLKFHRLTGCLLVLALCLLSGQRARTEDAVPIGTIGTAGSAALDKMFADDRELYRKQLAEAKDGTARAAAHIRIGQTFMGQRLYKEAREEFDEALKIKDADSHQLAEALLNRGSSYLGQQDFDRGRAEYTKALGLPNLQPADGCRIHSNLANLDMSQGQYAAARAEYAKTLQIPHVDENDKARARLASASTYFYAGDMPGAQAALEKLAAPDVMPASFQAQLHIMLGETWQRKGAYEKAIVEFTKLESLGAPVDSGMIRESQQLKGSCYLEAKQYPQARTEFDLLLRDKTTQGYQRVSIHERIADSYLGEHNYAAAQAEYVKAQNVPDIDQATQDSITVLMRHAVDMAKAH